MGNGLERRRGRDTDDPPGAWAAYGKLLRLFRDRTGLTQQQLGDAIGYSLEQVASVERGRRPAKQTFTEAAETTLEACGALRVLQEDVDHAKLPAFFRDAALLESEAISRFSYDPLLVPGLLQTEDYARALLNAHFPPLDEETVEERVSARIARQSLLTRVRPPFVFVFILEETVLHRQIGDPEVMRQQLTKLLECSRMRNVELQVMPTSRGAHSGLNGPMVLLETTDRQRYAYVETQDIVSVASDRDEVSELWLRHGMLRTQALDTEESARIIQRVAGEL
ncbi:Scr1 family TA system antitoxin-like transcriptional regulator [Streptomyces sp. TR06-5]|uniref:Scr1 family TA system antitoxin-like transcriptional regulator n=1 Tax=Streptomyces sp. TR06-5 TaxID=3385976 RepID=UPI0039A1E846